MINPVIKKNDKLAAWLIGAVSVVVFVVVVILGRVKVEVDLGFDKHVFAKINAMINSAVAVLLLLGLWFAKSKKYLLHKRMMMLAILLSVGFLLSYICHHLFTGETSFGGEGAIRIVYYTILISHIFLAGVILPFILFTAYRALTAEWPLHRRLAKYTWPLWFYVAVTGVVVYWMISPYYQ